MGMYKKISDIDYCVINEYKDIINFLGETKYNQRNILDKFELDLLNKNIEHDKKLYYYKYFTKIFDQIINTCDEEDEEYLLFKENTDMLLNILFGNIYISEEDIWKVLNENVYNIENKLLSLISILALSTEGYSIDVRKIMANKGSKYKVKYCCALKQYNKLIFRIYYSDYDKVVSFKLFPMNPLFKKSERNVTIIQSEKDLDDMLNEHIKIILGE